MSEEKFLLLNLALAFYNVGTIWAHEVDIFRSWKLLDPKTFKVAQTVHWKKIPYWVFTPVGLAFIGSVILLWYHPAKTPACESGLAFGALLLSNILTAFMWGPWQARLSKDELGGASPTLAKILRTHWIRTALINVYGLVLLYMTFQIV